MGKRSVLSGREVCRILEAEGFIRIRQRGSHVVMQQKSGQTTITVIVPDHREIKPGTLASIVRQSGVTKGRFNL